MPSSDQRPLFRQEVFEARSQSWLGTISLAQPMRWPLMAGLAMAMACIVVCMLAFGSYAPRLHASGQLVSISDGASAAQVVLSAPARSRPALVVGQRIVLQPRAAGDRGQRDLPGQVAAITRSGNGAWRILVDVADAGLAPGVRVDADLRGERRRLYEWAFAPMAR